MNIQHYKFQEPGYYDLSAATFSNYITHILGKIVGTFPIGMELMFSEYILGDLTLISDVISWVVEEQQTMSDKGFFKQFTSEK